AVVMLIGLLGCASAAHHSTASAAGSASAAPSSSTLASTSPFGPSATRGGPTRPTSRPPSKKLCGAPRNPFGYNFCGSQPGHDAALYSPDRRICRYFACAPGFFHQHGYVVECADGWFTQTGGTSRECKGHGGVQSVVFD